MAFRQGISDPGPKALEGKMKILGSFVLGFLLDLIFGDPNEWPHPVRFMGWCISTLEQWIRRYAPKTEKGELAGGILLVVIMVAVSFLLPFLILFVAGKINVWLRFILEALMCYQILAIKSLKTESMKVYKALKQEDIAGARQAVAMIVGRDTKSLTKEGIIKAAVETVAENTSDGVIAPMLFFAIGGAPFGFFYKAVNTMDSMIGYKNDNYLYFGRGAAKLDDIVNFPASRISAFVMLLSSYFCKLDGKAAFRIYKRDRFCHASPNSAQTEAVLAGALGIQLAGDAYYFGKLHKKDTIGDAKRKVKPEDIIEANRLLYTSAVIMLFLCSMVRIALWKLGGLRG